MGTHPKYTHMHLVCSNKHCVDQKNFSNKKSKHFHVRWVDTLKMRYVIREKFVQVSVVFAI
jgi:hypothetical protein